MTQIGISTLAEPDQGSLESEKERPQVGAQFLHSCLNAAFSPCDDPAGSTTGIKPSEEPISTFATATMRQAKAIQVLIDYVRASESTVGADSLREAISNLQELLARVEVQTNHISGETQSRFESLADTVAIMACHLATQREEAQRNNSAIKELSEDIKRLNDGTEDMRNESTQLCEVVRSARNEMQSSLTALKESVILLRDELGKATKRLATLERHVASQLEVENQIDDLRKGNQEFQQTKRSVVELSDRHVKIVKRIELLTKGLNSTNEDMGSVQRNSERMLTGLRSIEQAVDILSRREKILATLHQQAARTLLAD